MGAVPNAAAVECALTMGVVCTNTFPGTGLLWTNAANNSSDGSAWTQTQNLGAAWSSLTTTAASNVGTATGTGNASGSGAVWRTGASSPADAMTTAVISMSAASGTIGWGSASYQFGVITNKPATTANTFYVADLAGAISGKTTYYGLRIRKAVAGGFTNLLVPSATVTGVQNSTDKWVVQFRSTRIDGGTSLLLQARAWKGTNPASPPAGLDWVQSGVSSGTDYTSVAVIDSSSPLAAGRGGLMAFAAASATTYTAEQFEFRSMSATSNLATATGTASLTNVRARVLSVLANATATASSTIVRLRQITSDATATGTASLQNSVAVIRSVTATGTSLLSKTIQIVRSSTATGSATSSVQKLLTQPVKTLQLACRSTIKIMIDSKVGLLVRSTMKLPKE